MHPATRKLHEELIRHLKGCITAWCNWLKEIATSNTKAA